MKSYQESGLASNPRTLPPTATLPTDHPTTAYCIACGYEITGIDPDARCPECAFAISESLKPEVRGFGGLLTLTRFRIGIWLLAFLPLIILFSAAAQTHTGFRDLVLTYVFRAGRPFPGRWSPRTAWWFAASDRLDWACLILLALWIIATTALLILRPRALKDSIALSQTTPRWISIRTATIAAGCILSMSTIATGLIWDLTSLYFNQTQTTLLSTGTLLGLALLAWWIVALLASGRLRFAMLFTIAMLAAAATLEITARLWWHGFHTVGRGIAYSGIALMALNAGLLWRWFAKGFKRPILTAIATGYAALAPIAIAWTAAFIDESFVPHLMLSITPPPGAMLTLAALIAIISTTIGIVSARSLTAIKRTPDA
ncbi:MAG: hypothetical protein ACTS3F_00735 [Phycisphaerales bacterium]